MVQNEDCQNCHQKHDCREVYRLLGNSEGPSVVLKVIIAFLIPLVVFIVSLAVFEQFFTATISFVLALLVTLLCVYLLRTIDRRLS